MYNFNSTQRNAINKFIYDQYGEKQRSNVPTPNPSANASSASTLNTPTTTTSVGTATYYPTTTTSVSTATYRPTTTSSVGTATYYPTTTTSVSTATYRPTTTTPVTVTNNPTITTPVVSSTSDPSSTSSVTTTASIITDDYLMQQCIDKILKDYSRGNLRTEDLKSLLSTLKISVNVITKDNSIVAKFSAFNKSYTVVCVDKAAATSGVDSKKVNTFSASYISDYLGTTDKSVFDQFFTPVAISDNKVLEYAIKPDSQYKSLYEIYGVINAETKEFKRLVLINNYLTGYKDSTARESDDVNNMRKLHLANKSSAITRGNYRELLAKSDLDIKSIDAAVLQDLLNNVVNDFTKGNMTVNMFRTLIRSGLGATSVKTEKNTENNTTTITFEYNGKNYSVTCNSDAVKSAHDDNQVIVYNIADVQKELGITDDSVISRFFEVAAEQDGIATKVALKAEYESLDEVKDIIDTELDYLRKQIVANNYLSGNYKKAETLNVLYIQMFSTEDGKQKPISKVTYGTLINDPNMPAAKPLTVTQKNSVLNKAIADFTSGNLSVAMFKLLAKTIGVEESSIQSTTANGNATLTFTYEEKEYSVSCKTSAAQKSYDKNTVKTVTAQEFKEKYGFSDRLISLLVDNGILNSVVSIDGKNEVLTFVEGKSIENFFAEQIDGDNLKEAYYKVAIDDFMELYKEKYGYTPITEEYYVQTQYLTLMADEYYFDYWYDGSIKNLDDVISYADFLEEACSTAKSDIEAHRYSILEEEGINGLKDLIDKSSVLLNASSFLSGNYESGDLQTKQKDIVNELLYKSGFLQGNFKIDDLRFVLDMLAISHEITEENGYYVVKINVAENNYTMRCSVSAAENDNDHYSKNGGYNIENPPEQKTYTAEKLAKIYGISQLEIDALVNSGLLKVALEINGNAYQYTMPSREEYQFEQYETYIKRELSSTKTTVHSPVERLNDNGWFDADINELTSSLQQNKDYGHLLADNTKYQFKIGYGEPMIDYDILCEDKPTDVIDNLKKKMSDYMSYNSNNLEKTNWVTIYINPGSINNGNLRQINNMFYTSSSSSVDRTRVNGTIYFNPAGSSEIYADSSSNLGSDVLKTHILQGMTNELIEQKINELANQNRKKLVSNIDYTELLATIDTKQDLNKIYTALYEKALSITSITKDIESIIKNNGYKDVAENIDIVSLATKLSLSDEYDKDTFAENLKEILSYIKNTNETKIREDLNKIYQSTINKDYDLKNLLIRVINNVDDVAKFNLNDIKGIAAYSIDSVYEAETKNEVLVSIADMILSDFLGQCWENKTEDVTSADLLAYINKTLSDSQAASLLAEILGDDADASASIYTLAEHILSLKLEKEISDLKADFEKGIKLNDIVEAYNLGGPQRSAGVRGSSPNTYTNPFSQNKFNEMVKKCPALESAGDWFSGVATSSGWAIGASVASCIPGCGVAVGYGDVAIQTAVLQWNVYTDEDYGKAFHVEGLPATFGASAQCLIETLLIGLDLMTTTLALSTGTGAGGAVVKLAKAGVKEMAKETIQKTMKKMLKNGVKPTGRQIAKATCEALGIPANKENLRLLGNIFNTTDFNTFKKFMDEFLKNLAKGDDSLIMSLWKNLVIASSNEQQIDGNTDYGSSSEEITADSILDKWGKKATEKYDEEFGSLNEPFGVKNQMSQNLVTSTEDPSNLPPEYKIDGIDHLTVAEMRQKIINTLEGFYELLNLIKDLKYKCFEQYLQEKYKVSDINSLDDDDRKNYENLYTQTNIYLALNEKEMSYMTCIFDLEKQLKELQ